MTTRSGILLAIEGIDAVGKKTQSQLLRDWLERKNVKNELLGFPDYTTAIGKEIKAFLHGERNYPAELKHILFAANRWEKCEHLQDLLHGGAFVIVNRYTESNLVYGKANGLSVEWLASLEKGLPKTDVVVVLDAPPKLLISRRPSKKDVFEADILFQTKVREAYKELAARLGWLVVDATGTVQAVQTRVTERVSAKLQSLRKAVS